jgi:hypothetical protein
MSMLSQISVRQRGSWLTMEAPFWFLIISALQSALTRANTGWFKFWASATLHAVQTLAKCFV